MSIFRKKEKCRKHSYSEKNGEQSYLPHQEDDVTDMNENKDDKKADNKVTKELIQDKLSHTEVENHDEQSQNEDMENASVIRINGTLMQDESLHIEMENSDKQSCDDNMAKDLAILVFQAINVWKKKYHMENLPQDIVLNQAMDIILAYRDFMI